MAIGSLPLPAATICAVRQPAISSLIRQCACVPVMQTMFWPLSAQGDESPRAVRHPAISVPYCDKAIPCRAAQFSGKTAGACQSAVSVFACSSAYPIVFARGAALYLKPAHAALRPARRASSFLFSRLD